MLWIKEMKMFDSLDELKSSRSVYGKDFPNFEGSVSTRKTDRLHDLRLLSSDWCSWHSIGLCWFILCYSSWWQHSAIRYKMGRSSTVYVKDSLRWTLGKSVQIEDTWVWSTQNSIGIVRHGDSSEDIGSQLPEVEKTMAKRSIDQKLRLRNFDARHGRIESAAVVKNRKGIIGVEGGKGICHQWKEKSSVRKETAAVSATKPKIVRKNQNTLPPHLPSQPFHEVEVCQRREASEAKITMDPFFDYCVDIIWRVPARERLVNIGIRPSANL